MKRRSTGSKAERTRSFIIQKVAPIFNKKGYAGTSLSDLIHATGLTKGSIYGNFAGKDEVAICAFRYNVERILDPFASEMARVNSPLEKLLVYPKTYRKIYKELLKRGGCPILNTAVEADDTHPMLHKLAVDAFKQWKLGMIMLIEQGIACGEMKPETDAEMVAELIIILFEGGGALAKTTGEESFILHAISQVEQVIQSLKA